MRLLLINYEYPPIGGGAATATEKIAQGLLALGHEVTVLTAAFGDLRGIADEAGVRVWRIPARRTRADRSSLAEMASYVASAILAIPRVLRACRPQGCITFFSVPCGPLGWWAGRLGRIPYVISLRGGDVPGTERSLDRIHRLIAPMRRFLLRGAAAVVANSPGLKALSEGVDPVSVTVIPNGVDHEFFKPPAVRHADSHFEFLFVGRLNEQKNVSSLLDAFASLRGATSLPVRLRIVGDGPLKAGLVAQADRLALAGHVVWETWRSRPEMPMVYANADCLVNPSLYEGMPNVLLEAMSCGLAVIASRVAGNVDVVRHGQSGLLVPVGDQARLCDAMLSVMVDREGLRLMGDKARAFVSRDYSWPATSAAYAALFSRANSGAP
jgi:glycosyltransferase involved in cell wall biosynthesis